MFLDCRRCTRLSTGRNSRRVVRWSKWEEETTVYLLRRLWLQNDISSQHDDTRWKEASFVHYGDSIPTTWNTVIELFRMRLLYKPCRQHKEAQDEPRTEREIQMLLLQFLIEFPIFCRPPLQIRASSKPKIDSYSGTYNSKLFKLRTYG